MAPLHGRLGCILGLPVPQSWSKPRPAAYACEGPALHYRHVIRYPTFGSLSAILILIVTIGLFRLEVVAATDIKPDQRESQLVEVRV